jgi:hypothetical protein
VIAPRRGWHYKDVSSENRWLRTGVLPGAAHGRSRRDARGSRHRRSAMRRRRETPSLCDLTFIRAEVGGGNVEEKGWEPGQPRRLTNDACGSERTLSPRRQSCQGGFPGSGTALSRIGPWISQTGAVHGERGHVGWNRATRSDRIR